MNQTTLPDQPYRADWVLQDYLDAADAERDRRGRSVSPNHRGCFVDGRRFFQTSTRLAIGSVVTFGDAFAVESFRVVR